jgi:signal transduction histidine kinase
VSGRAGAAEPGAEPTVLLVRASGAEDAAWRGAVDAAGGRLVVAAGYPEALDTLDRHDVAAAIVDMPAAPEHDAAARTALVERLGALNAPVLLLAEHPSAEAAVPPGSAEIVTRPAAPSVLRGRVAALVETARARRLVSAQRDELARVRRTSERLIAVLGHDLRSPLNAISLAAETLLLARPDDATAALIADRLRSATRRMSRTVAQVVDFAALYSGSGPLEPVDVDLAQLCRTAAEELEELRHRPFTCTADGDCRGRWDAHRLLQLFSHLLGYALQHGRDNGAIAVRIDGRAPDQVVVELEHEGAVPEPARPHLFTPFAAGAEARGNVPLGPYIVAQVAEAHGGSVTAEWRGDRTILRATLPRRFDARPRA